MFHRSLPCVQVIEGILNCCSVQHTCSTHGTGRWHNPAFFLTTMHSATARLPCRYNFILTNVFKTKTILFTILILTIHGTEVKSTKMLEYVGVHLVNSPSNQHHARALCTRGNQSWINCTMQYTMWSQWSKDYHLGRGDTLHGLYWSTPHSCLWMLPRCYTGFSY